ncbi:MAG: plasmid stabilization protein [Acidobacteriota bacterium]|nr:plasmid stabilization protein [Acidobacteriota bacterium]
MPRGDKSKYTDKQKRQAEHIEESYKEKGVSEDEAEERAWATVNIKDGGNLSGSGRKKSASSKSEKDAPDRDSSATRGGAGARPPSDS